MERPFSGLVEKTCSLTWNPHHQGCALVRGRGGRTDTWSSGIHAHRLPWRYQHPCLQGHLGLGVSPASMVGLEVQIFVRVLMAPPASHALGPVLWAPAAPRGQGEPGLGGERSPPCFSNTLRLCSQSLFSLPFSYSEISQFSFAFGKQKPERLVSPFFPPPYLTLLGQRSTEKPGAGEPGEEKVNV